MEINAPPKKVWEAIEDPAHISRWNMTVKEITRLEPDKGSVKSTTGDFTYAITEQIKNKMISVKTEHPDIKGYGFILKEKGDMTDLSYWVDYKIVEHEKILERSNMVILNGLKNFVEFLEDGGDPDEYDPKQILEKP
ncbi:MAG: SRPBCC family protein [Promethearchaeota archaeon]|nr:MAG: SRPBCC family protein [Candidatus Lokiarchaeota archaeon]